MKMKKIIRYILPKSSFLFSEGAEALQAHSRKGLGGFEIDENCQKI